MKGMLLAVSLFASPLLCGVLPSCCWAGRLSDEACDVLVVGSGAAGIAAAGALARA